MVCTQIDRTISGAPRSSMPMTGSRVTSSNLLKGHGAASTPPHAIICSVATHPCLPTLHHRPSPTTCRSSDLPDCTTMTVGVQTVKRAADRPMWSEKILSVGARPSQRLPLVMVRSPRRSDRHCLQGGAGLIFLRRGLHPPHRWYDLFSSNPPT